MTAPMSKEYLEQIFDQSDFIAFDMQEKGEEDYLAWKRAIRKNAPKSPYRKDVKFWESFRRLVSHILPPPLPPLYQVFSASPPFYQVFPAGTPFYGGTTKQEILVNVYSLPHSEPHVSGEQRFFQYFHFKDNAYLYCYYDQVFVFSLDTNQILRTYTKRDVKKFIESPDGKKLTCPITFEDGITNFTRMSNEFYPLWVDFINRHIALPSSATSDSAECARLYSVLRYYNRKSFLALKELDRIMSNDFKILDNNLVLCSRIQWGLVEYNCVTMEHFKHCRVADRKTIKQLLLLRRQQLALLQKEINTSTRPEQSLLSCFEVTERMDNQYGLKIGYRKSLVQTPGTDAFTWHTTQNYSLGSNDADIATTLVPVYPRDLENREQWFPQLIDFFYYTTSGSPEKLAEFAHFLADCVSPAKKNPLHIFAFHASHSHRLHPFLTSLLKLYSIPLLTCRDLLNKKSTLTLLHLKARYSLPVIIEVDAKTLKSLSDEQKKRLKKILTGATVSSNDSVFKTRRCKSTVRFIVCGNNAAIFELSHIGIPIQRPSFELPEPQQTLTIPPAVFAWISTYLLPWAIVQRNKKAEKKGNKNEATPMSVTSFVEHRCCLYTDEICLGEKLHDYYVIYCEKLGCSSVLRSEFDALLQKDFDLVRYRPHFPNQRNQFYFKNITLLEEAVEAFDDNSPALIQSIKKSELEHTLALIEAEQKEIPILPPPPPSEHCDI